jgi:DNA-binding MarR family transcriptional regulator
MAISIPTPTDSQLDQRELTAWCGLLQVHGALTKALDARLEAEHGLPLTSFEVLRRVDDAERGRMRMCDLASSVLLSRSGLTRLVDRLERDGYLARQSCADDARGQFAVLTDGGRAKLDAARATHRATVRTLFLEHFSADELDAMAGMFERVIPGALAAAGRGCC